MSSEPELNTEELASDYSQLNNFFNETFKKFDSITFNQEKYSFIIQILSVVLTTKLLDQNKGFFKDWFTNEWKNTDLSKEEQFSSFYTNLINFVVTYIDPAFITNDLAYYIASNEENYANLVNLVTFFLESFPNDAFSQNDVIDKFYSSFLSYSKPKKDYNLLNVSEVTLKFLLLNSLQNDLDQMNKLLESALTEGNEELKNQFLEKIISYRILDPFTFTGTLLIHAFSFLMEFYNKTISLIKENGQDSSLVSDICSKLLGKQTAEISKDELINVLVLRHIFAITPEKDTVLVTKLHLYLMMNTIPDVENPIKTHLYFNIVKGNILLDFTRSSENDPVVTILEDEKYQELANERNDLANKYQQFILTKDHFESIKETKDKLSNLIREEYLKLQADLKIKSDLQEKLAIINPNIEFGFLSQSNKDRFSLIIGFIPIKLRLNITMTKILIKNYYEKPEDEIRVVNLFANRFLDLTGQDGKLAILVPRNVFYQGEYTNLRKRLLDTTCLDLLIDFGDYKYQRQSKGTALVITDKKDGLIDNVIQGWNIASLEQEKKEELLVSMKDESEIENQNNLIIHRQIAQKEFQETNNARFFIKKPSKWFTKFSEVPNTLHEYIESIENGVKLGDNKVLYISDQKVKELQLEQNLLKNSLKGRHFHRYSIPDNKSVIIIPAELSEEQIQTENPKIWAYLEENRQVLEARPQVKRGTIKWYQIVDAEKVTEAYVKPPKIFLREKANQPVAVFDTRGMLQVSTTLALRFTKQVRFRDYFKILAWINSLVVKAGYQDLTQDTKTDSNFNKESLHDVTIPLAILKDDPMASNVQQIVQMCFANKFSFNPHLLLLEYPEGQFHPDIYNFLFNKISEVLIKKMKNIIGNLIKIEDIAIITINQENKKKKVDYNYLYPIYQDYAKSILVLNDGDIEITFKMKPRQAYTLPFLQLFLAYQPKDMILTYLKTYTKPEPLETIIGGWPIPELQMKHVMETYNFVRFQRQNFINFFNRTRNMLIKVETQIATHYGFKPEEISELLADRELIEN